MEVRHIPIIDPDAPPPPPVSSDDSATEPRIMDTGLNRATAEAVVAVTLFWFAVATGLMWLAGWIGEGTSNPALLSFCGCFTLSSVCIFAIAIGGNTTSSAAVPALTTFLCVLVSAVGVTYLGALVEVRWVVLPLSYGVGLFLTRTYRQEAVEHTVQSQRMRAGDFPPDIMAAESY